MTAISSRQANSPLHLSLAGIRRAAHRERRTRNDLATERTPTRSRHLEGPDSRLRFPVETVSQRSRRSMRAQPLKEQIPDSGFRSRLYRSALEGPYVLSSVSQLSTSFPVSNLSGWIVDRYLFLFFFFFFFFFLHAMAAVML